jgi:hypothetical protein
MFIIGSIVKSAQFPFYTWLQDAMEAKLPVSALLHSSTLVAVGFYLTLRLLPFYTLEPILLKILAYLGIITALLCSLSASAQTHPKKVLAYSTSAQLGSVTITNVTITPTGATSQYEYITNIKPITQNYFVKTFSNTSTSFYINSYSDDTTNKIITSQCKISPLFTIPTGTGINNIDIYLDNQEFNYSFGQSVGTSYNTSNNFISYEFTATDKYGERGYKLPYFYAKFALKHKTTNYMSYVYALWEPNTSNTGIELTSLILDE